MVRGIHETGITRRTEKGEGIHTGGEGHTLGGVIYMVGILHGTGVTQKRERGNTWRGDIHGEGTYTEKGQTRGGDTLEVGAQTRGRHTW